MTFTGDAEFSRTTFRGHAYFPAATFLGRANFSGATFNGHAYFSGATFTRDADFRQAVFIGTRWLGPLTTAGALVLHDADFVHRITITVAARTLSARGANFTEGVDLRVRGAEIALDNADFVRASTVSGAANWTPHLAELSKTAVWSDELGHALSASPRLATVRGATVSELALSNIDPSGCRFRGAHGLESIRIEEGCRWPPTPESWRYTVRTTIAEEQHWRVSADANRPRDWQATYVHPPAWLENRDGTDPLEPGQIANLYRALRKAREDSKDEAGSLDFYYGEMEMRRQAEQLRVSLSGLRRAGQGLLLTAYWLSSGSGSRASRALASLALTLLACAALLSWFGFRRAQSYGSALLFALDSSISLLRAPTAILSAGGQVVDVALRLLGPLFFGLALLALRSRVKR